MIAGFEQIVEKRIQAAIEDGAFDNLPGAGLPLELDDDGPDREMWLANRILKNAGCLPPWVEVGRELDLLEDASVQLAREHYHWVSRQAQVLRMLVTGERQARRLGIEAMHQRYCDRFRSVLEELLELTDLHSRFVPSGKLARPGFWIEARMRRFEVDFAPLRAMLDGMVAERAEEDPGIGEWEARQRRLQFFRRWRALSEKLARLRSTRRRRARGSPSFDAA